jgi:hypothetical protein
VPDKEPAWIRLVLDPMLKIGEGVLMGVLTVVGALVWFVLVIIALLSFLGGQFGER